VSDRPARRRGWGRRETALVVSAAMVLGLGVGGNWYLGRDRLVDKPLYLETMALDAHGGLARVDPGSGAELEPGTHVLQPASGAPAADVHAADGLATAQRDWLLAGSVPGAGTSYEDMARQALLDLHTMTLANGAVLAAGSGPWQYAWPRDGAFAAAAYAATGHLDDARRVLGFFQGVQAPDGQLEARYLPDGSGPPDDRTPQLDGLGWMLWALGRTVDATPATQRASTIAGLRDLLDRSASAAEATLAKNGLPPASPDYWEKREKKLTLGTAAPLLAGLRSAAALYTELGDASEATAASTSADRLAAAITREFGPDYGRYARSDQRDAAVAFLLPPFAPTADPGVTAALEASVGQMQRPAGGLAPGAAWPHDGVSWTPETAVVALGAAGAGDTALAHRLLDWLDSHRTATGSIPEKVLFDGRPAGTAPLVWSAATVLLTITALDGR
jgi:GH15 family glucan-1,4-alpha-glucosidase